MIDVIIPCTFTCPIIGLAVDLGGLINKAAYLFSIATMETGSGTIAMTACMAGGMVSPLEIALPTSLFRNYEFKKKDKQVLFVM